VKKIRKVNTQKRKKKRKDAQKRLAQQTSLMMKHPTECCMCDLHFKRTPQTIKTWKVTIVEERVRLTCPTCWGVFVEALEKNEDG